MRVVLDTNVVFEDPVLVRDAATRMLELLAPARATLVFSPVVLGELNRRRRDDVEGLHAPTRSRIRKMAALAGGDPSELLAQAELMVEAAADRWSSRWHQILAHPNVEVGAWPKIDSQQMAERELHRRRPFMDKGPGTVGHRDTLIWLGVVELAREDPYDDILFVTADKGFHSDSGLHPHLVEDLKQAGAQHTVTWLRSLPALVAALQKETEASGWDAWREARVAELLYDVIRAFEPDDFVEHWDDRDGDTAPPAFDLGPPFAGHDWHLSNVDGPQDLKLEEAAFGADELICSFVVDIHLSGFIDKFEWYSDDHPDVELWDADWNEHVVSVEATRRVRLRARFEIDDDNELAYFDEFLDYEVVPEDGAVTLG